MARKLKVRRKRTIREHALLSIPLLLDNFIRDQPRVVGHPRTTRAVHQMRIKGKPMRYTMEDMESLFSDDFEGYVGDLKQVLELMGNIHEIDVALPLLREQLRDLATYNNVVRSRREQIRTASLRSVMKDLRQRRHILFLELCQRLTSWKESGFRERLTLAMSQTATP